MIQRQFLPLSSLLLPEMLGVFAAGLPAETVHRLRRAFRGSSVTRRDGRSRCGPVVASRSVGVRACAFVNRTVGGVRRAGALRRQVPVAASVIGVERG